MEAVKAAQKENRINKVKEESRMEGKDSITKGALHVLTAMQ